MTAGYSGTPLWKKLALDDGQRVLATGMPPSVKALLPPEIGVKTRGRGPWHAVLLFVTRRADLAAALPERLPTLAPAEPKRGATPARRAGFIWVAWPKKTPAKGAATITTDLTEDVIREVALPLGLVDVKVCAIDGAWSGLMLVVRKT
ncbi:MAG: hypothetical protein IT385_01140 [Deltaproteobacteria bacterium]|nr:hypothetical protein [Deltaproteobacteria bacterium]